MLSGNCKSLQNTSLGGVYYGSCCVADHRVNVLARYIYVDNPTEGCPICSLKVERGSAGGGREVALVGDTDG